MMRRFFAGTLACLMVLGLAACGQVEDTKTPASGENASEKVVHVFTKKREWNWDRIKEAFEASHPGYVLNVDITEATDYYNLLKTYVTTGDLPDVIQTIPGSTIDLWKEYLVDISDLECFDKMDPEITNAYYEDGAHYGVPLFAEYHGVIYNMTYLEQVGFSEAPKTIDEFVALNKALIAAGLPTGISPWKGATAMIAHMSAPIFGAKDNSLSYYQGIQSGTVDLTSDKDWGMFLDYIDAVRQYGNADALNTDNTTERNAMYAGEYAWYGHDGSWVTPALRATNPEMEQNLRLGVYPYSSNPNENKIGVSTQSLSIMNTENVEAAKVFVDWLLGSDEGTDILVKDCNTVVLRTDYEIRAEDVGALAVQGRELSANGYGANNFRNMPDSVIANCANSLQKYIAQVIDRNGLLNEVAKNIQNG